MGPILLQKQVRDNAEDVQNYLLDLKQWEKEMKRKEEKLSSDTSDNKDGAPVCSKVKKSLKSQTKNGEKKKLEDEREKKYFSDYAAWDKFDADKACELIDKEEEYKVSENNQGKESITLDMKRSRDEAYYEKEMGNKFVKLNNWKEALACYTRAIEKYSHDAVFYANRALCHLKLHNPTAAEADCTRSLNLDPEYVKAYQRRATARTELKHYQEAREDLLKALGLEANNKFIKDQLSKLEENLRRTEQVQKNSENIIEGMSSEALEGTSSEALEGTSSEALEGTSSEAVEGMSSEALNTSLVSTQEIGDRKHLPHPTGNQHFVLPITKPPHLRSKKPLKRIEIKEITDTEDDKNSTSIPEANQPVNVVPQTDNNEIAPMNADSKKKESLTHCVSNEQQCEEKTIENPMEEESSVEIPSPPSSSVQFITTWNAFKKKPERRFQYLKQIAGDKLPTIFRESMESNVLSEIITTLEKDFLQHKVAVYPYLKGLSQIKRFGALTMFLSKNDKSGLGNLLDFCKANNECTEEEAAYLRSKYEL